MICESNRDSPYGPASDRVPRVPRPYKGPQHHRSREHDENQSDRGLPSSNADDYPPALELHLAVGCDDAIAAKAQESCKRNNPETPPTWQKSRSRGWLGCD